MSKNEFISHGPDVVMVASGTATVQDHLGRSDIGVTCWGNGEGFTVDIEADGAKQMPRQLELTWQEWGALKAVVRKVQKADNW